MADETDGSANSNESQTPETVESASSDESYESSLGWGPLCDLNGMFENEPQIDHPGDKYPEWYDEAPSYR